MTITDKPLQPNIDNAYLYKNAVNLFLLSYKQNDRHNNKS